MSKRPCRYTTGRTVYLRNGRYDQQGKVVRLERDKGGWWVVVLWTNSKGREVESRKREKSVYASRRD